MSYLLKRGYSLLEIIPVLLIVLTIFLVAMPNIQSYMLDAHLLNLKKAVAQCKRDMRMRIVENLPVGPKDVEAAVIGGEICKGLTRVENIQVVHSTYYGQWFHLYIDFDDTWSRVAGTRLGLRYDYNDPSRGLFCHSYGETLGFVAADVRDKLCK